MKNTTTDKYASSNLEEKQNMKTYNKNYKKNNTGKREYQKKTIKENSIRDNTNNEERRNFVKREEKRE